MGRSKAEKWLSLTDNPDGAFLVRVSSPSECSLSLSLRGVDSVKHYRIRQVDDSGYYLTTRVTFCTIQDLINHYKKDADGLAQQLSVPCVCFNQPTTKSLSYKDEWEIDQNSLQFEKKLGTGKFGEVWSGLWNKSVPVAIKILNPGIVDLENFKAKAKGTKVLHHPNLLKLYAVCTLEEHIYIVTDLVKHGTLLDYLRKGDGKDLKLPQLIDMAAQVAEGMAYLTEHAYIHGNLAARNILVSDRNVCRVADYGIYEKGTTKWTAPEVLLYNRFSNMSDVWSFGIVIYEIITYGQFPYPGIDNSQVLEYLQSGYRMPCPLGCPDRLHEIMRTCWRDDTFQRPTFETLKFHLEDFFISNAENGLVIS